MLPSFSDHISRLDLCEEERESIAFRRKKIPSLILIVVGVSVLLAVDG